MTRSDAALPGWHGKLPVIGDFAGRRIDPAFLAAWDRWLDGELQAMARQPGWPAGYLDSPSWRFLLMPGVLPGEAAERAWVGVLMPSVDRVGRYYPLTLACPLTSLPVDAQGVRDLWSWVGELDQLAAQALHEDWGLERLDAELCARPCPTPPEPEADLPQPRADAPVVALALGRHPHVAALLAAQSARHGTSPMRGLAFWSAVPEQQPPRQFVSRGLPPQSLLPRLFGG